MGNKDKGGKNTKTVAAKDYQAKEAGQEGQAGGERRQEDRVA